MAAASSVAVADPLRVGIIGDQTASTDLDQSYGILSQGVAALQPFAPKVVLHVGDMVESTSAEDEITRRFSQARAILDTLGVPWFMTPGDHDVNPPLWAPDSTDRSREALFQRLYAQVNPRVTNQLYYSFDVPIGDQVYHFIALDALENLNTDPRWGDVYFAGLSPAQQAWLKADLQANSSAAGTVVWLHQPLWYNWSTWAPVHQLLAQHQVSAVIAGHFHYNQEEGAIDGIDYRVVGATGGMVKQANAYAGGAQHVTVMTLEGRDVSFQMIPLGAAAPTTFTPRYDMDRVIAESYILDNLWGFWGSNPVSLLDGVPVSSCTSTTPATLTFTQLGNPIDIPTTLELSFSSAVAQLASSQFNAGVCASTTPAGLCELPANTNISMSNTSISTLNTYAPVTLWQATLGGTGATEPGTATLTASFSYVSPISGLPLQISSSVTTSVPVCSAKDAQMTEVGLARLNKRRAAQGVWIPAADSLPRTAQVEVSGGPGLGRIALNPSDVRDVEGAQCSVRVGARATILEQPHGVMPHDFEAPNTASACQHLTCVGAGVPPGAWGTLICCDTGEVLGTCPGSWGCSAASDESDPQTSEK